MRQVTEAPVGGRRRFVVDKRRRAAAVGAAAAVVWTAARDAFVDRRKLIGEAGEFDDVGVGLCELGVEHVDELLVGDGALLVLPRVGESGGFPERQPEPLAPGHEPQPLDVGWP